MWKPGGQKLVGKPAGKFALIGRSRLKPGGGDNGIGVVGTRAVVGRMALLWDLEFAGAGEGAGEALCTSSWLSWPVMEGCLGGFKQLLTGAKGRAAKVDA